MNKIRDARKCRVGPIAQRSNFLEESYTQKSLREKSGIESWVKMEKILKSQLMCMDGIHWQKNLNCWIVETGFPA